MDKVKHKEMHKYPSAELWVWAETCHWYQFQLLFSAWWNSPS